MPIETLEELFEHELEDVYYAEHELLDVLDELARQTESDEIARAFEDHREETRTHVDRVEHVFEMIGEPPDEEECEGIQGLIEEHQAFVDADPDQGILDLYNLAAAQKTEHYEISAYGNLTYLAKELGMDDAADILSKNLESEKEALQTLKDLTENYDTQKLPA